MNIRVFFGVIGLILAMGLGGGGLILGAIHFWEAEIVFLTLIVVCIIGTAYIVAQEP